MTKATHSGELDIAGIKLDCYVLDDPQRSRVLSRRGVDAALELRSGGPNLEAITKKSNIRTPLADMLGEPLKFKLPAKLGGALAYGYDAKVLPRITFLVVNAALRGAEFSPSLLWRCSALSEAFAVVGVTALVDEATGFQEERERDALRKILSDYIAPELRPWTPKFPVEFFREMFRLKGWSWSGDMTGPRQAGKYVNWMIYERMPDEVLAELRKRNPSDGWERRSKHHQLLTDEATAVLYRLIGGAYAMMKSCRTWPEHVRKYNMIYPKHGQQLLLDVEDHEDDRDPPATTTRRPKR